MNRSYLQPGPGKVPSPGEREGDINSKSPNVLFLLNSETSLCISFRFSNMTGEARVPVRIPETAGKKKKNPSGNLLLTIKVKN